MLLNGIGRITFETLYPRMTPVPFSSKQHQYQGSWLKVSSQETWLVKFKLQLFEPRFLKSPIMFEDLNPLLISSSNPLDAWQLVYLNHFRTCALWCRLMTCSRSFFATKTAGISLSRSLAIGVSDCKKLKSRQIENI